MLNADPQVMEYFPNTLSLTERRKKWKPLFQIKAGDFGQ